MERGRSKEYSKNPQNRNHFFQNRLYDFYEKGINPRVDLYISYNMIKKPSVISIFIIQENHQETVLSSILLVSIILVCIYSLHSQVCIFCKVTKIQLCYKIQFIDNVQIFPNLLHLENSLTSSSVIAQFEKISDPLIGNLNKSGKEVSSIRGPF